MSKRPSTKRAGRKSSAKPKPKRREEPIEIAVPKRGRGRPTTYDPAYCERVIALGEEGKSKAQIARALGCSRKSLYLWMRVHPEFAEAMKEAGFAALAWWEDVGQAGLTIPKFNAALYAFNMKNRFREFYSDKVELEHTDTTDPGERQLTDLDLARRIAFIFARGQAELREQQLKERGESDIVPDGTKWPELIRRQ